MYAAIGWNLKNWVILTHKVKKSKISRKLLYEKHLFRSGLGDITKVKWAGFLFSSAIITLNNRNVIKLVVFAIESITKVLAEGIFPEYHFWYIILVDLSEKIGSSLFFGVLKKKLKPNFRDPWLWITVFAFMILQRTC